MFTELAKEFIPLLLTNGRYNHLWFQAAISILTGEELTPGGQGNSLPDLFWNQENRKRIEVKGLTTKEFENNSPVRVSASKFFAGNSGKTQIINLGDDWGAIRELIFEASYANNDYFMLTLTCGVDADEDLENIKILFVETSLLVDNLISERGVHHHTTTSGKKCKKMIKYPCTHADLESLKSSLGSI